MVVGSHYSTREAGAGAGEGLMRKKSHLTYYNDNVIELSIFCISLFSLELEWLIIHLQNAIGCPVLTTMLAVKWEAQCFEVAFYRSSCKLLIRPKFNIIDS